MTVALENDRFWTYEDYLELPEDGNRYEIIHGRLYVSPPPTPFHQTVSRRVQFLLYQLELEGKGFVFNAPVGLRMPYATPVEPDLIFLRPEQRELIEEKLINGVPHLLVEIISPSSASRDRTLKLNLYAESGVPYYWIVDPAAKTLEVFELEAGSYKVKAALNCQDAYLATEVGDITIKLGEIFQGYDVAEREQ